jgi:hypothetical protein
MRIKFTKYCKFNLITLSHANFLFDHMLLNSFVHIDSSSIIKKHGELTKKFM